VNDVSKWNRANSRSGSGSGAGGQSATVLRRGEAADRGGSGRLHAAGQDRRLAAAGRDILVPSQRWRQARDRGRLAALDDQKRGPKPAGMPPGQGVARLQRENERLAARLEQAEAIIEVQKKLSLLLGPSLKETERSDKP